MSIYKSVLSRDMGIRIIIRHSRPELFRAKYESLRQNRSTRIYRNDEWNLIEKSMSVFIARGHEASEQLSRFLVGKSLVLAEPQVLGTQNEPRTVSIMADEIICWDRPFIEYRKIGKKGWNFSEYKNIQWASLLTRSQMWEATQREDFSTQINQVNLILNFWDMASCGQLRDAVEALGKLSSYELHRIISTSQFDQIGKILETETPERFWFIMDRREEDFHDHFRMRAEQIQPKSVGEFRDGIRRGLTLREILAGIWTARNYERSRFREFHGKDLEALCSYFRTIKPTHST